MLSIPYTRNASFSLHLRLGAMMLFQYMMFAVWWIPLAAYLANLDLSRSLTALILSSMAFGSIGAPMVGMLADRFFQGRSVLAVSNAIVGVMLMVAAMVSQPWVLFLALLVIMFFYMPTWAITSAIVLKSVSPEQFPRIRAFGTIGWILAGVFSVVSVGWLNIDFDGTRLPFYVGAVISIIAALINLTLPATPPAAKGEKSSWIDIMGFRSISMFKDRSFSIFMVIFFFSMLPFSMYWSYFSEYLADSGYKLITVTMNTGQLLELAILLTVPLFIRRFGLRKTMIAGLIALVIRYLALYIAGGQAYLPFVLAGAGVHGLIFGYYHLGAQIYADKKAPLHLKSQAQGMLFFVTFAMGLLAGNFVCGWIITMFSTVTPEGMVYEWDYIWGVTALMSVAVLGAFLVFFKDDQLSGI
jgi:nucleoside transporter